MIIFCNKFTQKSFIWVFYLKSIILTYIHLNIFNIVLKNLKFKAISNIIQIALSARDILVIRFTIKHKKTFDIYILHN